MPAIRTRDSSPKAAMIVACVALFTDMFIYGLVIPVLPLLPATVDAGPTATGMLFAGYAAAMLLVTPFAGVLVDRTGPRLPLLIGLIGLAGATLLFAVGGPYALLLVGRVLQGAAAGLAWVASLSLIAATVPLERRGTAMGMAMSMVSLGILAGPPIGGLLVENFGTVVPFLLAAALAVLDGIARAVFVRGDRPASHEPTGPLAVLRVRGTVPVIIVVLISAAMIAAIEPLLPLHLTRAFGMTPSGIGVLFGLTVIVGVILNPIVGSLLGRIHARILVIGGVVTAAVGLALLAIASSLGVVIAGMVLLGVAVALLSAPGTTLIGLQGQQFSPPAIGGSYTLFNLAYAVGLMAGPAISGFLAGAFSLTVALTVTAASILVAGLLASARLPSGLLARHP